MTKRTCVVVIAAMLVVSVCGAAPTMSWRQVIPAAASTPGAEGSHWRTDLVIFNPDQRAAVITIALLPSGGASVLSEALSVTLDEPVAPGQTLVVTDVLGSAFPGHRLGALEISARDAVSERVMVVASSRTWTPTEDGSGSYGQGIPGVARHEDGDLAHPERILAELESSELFRSNLGIVNLSETLEEWFTVEIYGADGDHIGIWYQNVGPRSHVQINNFIDRLGFRGGKGTVVVRLTEVNDLAPGGDELSSEPDFVAYASKIDQSTNDPFYISEQTDERRIGTERYQLVPVAAAAEGENSSYWRTDLTIHYPGDEALVVAFVELVPTQGHEVEGDPPRFTVFLLEGQTVTVEDVLGTKFAGHSVGALLVRASGSTENLVVSTRTWTPDGEAVGSLGQGIPGIPLVAGSDAVVIPGLEETADFRSNLGLVNPSTNLRETFKVEIFDAAGSSRGSRSYTMQPWSHLQLNGLLGDLGLAGTAYSAVVSMTDSENLFVDASGSWDPFVAAYGSVVDQKTNDPTYVAGIPLRQPPAAGEGDWYDFERQAPWYLCPEEPWPAEATVVRAFDQAYHYFGGGENFRSITEQVEFPAAGDWNQVGLYLHLECPESGDCDDWDRTGSLQLVLNPEAPEEEWEYLEIMRHITPYKINMCEYVDVTPLASLLAGTRTLVSWIDTWVGPGHGQGEGWRISFDFVFYPGEPRVADEVINIWGRRSLTVGYPGTDNNVDVLTEPVTVSIPATATRVEARLIATGHAFGNSLNCAEFCPMRQDLYVNDQLRSVLPWRTDCEHNPHSPQSGTWQYDRNGWCPGAIVVGDTIDISDLVTPGDDAVIDLDIRLMDGEIYENTAPGEYDPFEWVSLQLYVYEE